MRKNIYASMVTGFVLASSSVALADDTHLNWEYADLCDDTLGAWNECAPVNLVVGPGETATVEVETTATFYEDDMSQSVLVCIGIRSSSESGTADCISSAEAGSDLDVDDATVGDDLDSVATSAVHTLTAGTYVISSLIAPQDDPLDIEPLQDVGKVRTKVRVSCDGVCDISSFALAPIVVGDGAEKRQPARD